MKVLKDAGIRSSFTTDTPQSLSASSSPALSIFFCKVNLSFDIVVMIEGPVAIVSTLVTSSKAQGVGLAVLRRVLFMMTTKEKMNKTKSGGDWNDTEDDRRPGPKKEELRKFYGNVV